MLRLFAAMLQLLFFFFLFCYSVSFSISFSCYCSAATLLLTTCTQGSSALIAWPGRYSSYLSMNSSCCCVMLSCPKMSYSSCFLYLHVIPWSSSNLIATFWYCVDEVLKRHLHNCANRSAIFSWVHSWSCSSLIC